jgi:hypothetical protein
MDGTREHYVKSHKLGTEILAPHDFTHVESKKFLMSWKLRGECWLLAAKEE